MSEDSFFVECRIQNTGEHQLVSDHLRFERFVAALLRHLNNPIEEVIHGFRIRLVCFMKYVTLMEYVEVLLISGVQSGNDFLQRPTPLGFAMSFSTTAPRPRFLKSALFCSPKQERKVATCRSGNAEYRSSRRAKSWKPSLKI